MKEYKLEKIKQDLIFQLKEITTYDDLIALEKNLHANNLLLRSKGRKLRAFSFHHMYSGQHLIEPNTEDKVRFINPKYKNRVTYLFNDGVSKGESYIKNLHRNLEIYG